MFKKIKDNKGVTAIEYAVISVLIIVAVIVSVALLGKNLTGVFTVMSNSI